MTINPAVAIVALLVSPGIAQDCDMRTMFEGDFDSGFDLVVWGDNVFASNYYYDHIRTYDIRNLSGPFRSLDLSAIGSPTIIARDGRTLAASMYDLDAGNPIGVAITRILDNGELTLESFLPLPPELAVYHVDASDGVLVGAAPAGFVFIDIKDPASPSIIGTLQAPTYASWKVAIDGSFVYLLSEDLLQIVDLSLLPAIHVVASVDVPNYLGEIDVEGGLALVQESGGLHVIDVSDPTTPIVLAHEACCHSWLGGGVEIIGNLAITIQAGHGCAHTVAWIVNLSDPASLESFYFDMNGGTGCTDGIIALPDALLTGGGQLTLHEMPSCLCIADVDADADVDSDDFFAFMDAFASRSLRFCDLDSDEDCDARDFFAYLELFARGCE